MLLFTMNIDVESNIRDISRKQLSNKWKTEKSRETEWLRQQYNPNKNSRKKMLNKILIIKIIDKKKAFQT